MADQNQQNQGQNQGGGQTGGTPPWMDFTAPLPGQGGGTPQSGSTSGAQGDATQPVSGSEEASTEVESATPNWMDFSAPSTPTESTPQIEEQSTNQDTPPWMQFTPDIVETPVQDVATPITTDSETTWEQDTDPTVPHEIEEDEPEDQTDLSTPEFNSQPEESAAGSSLPSDEFSTPAKEQAPWENQWNAPETSTPTVDATQPVMNTAYSSEENHMPSHSSVGSASHLLVAFKDAIEKEQRDIHDEIEMYETKIRVAKEEIKALKQKAKDKMLEIQRTIKDLEHMLLLGDEKSKKKDE